MSNTMHLITSVLDNIDAAHNITQGLRHLIAAAPPEVLPIIQPYMHDINDLFYAITRHEQYLIQSSENPSQFMEIGE